MSAETVRAYIYALQKEHAAGHAREHSYRPALKALVEELCPDLDATNEPKHSDYGAPDLIFTRKNNKELVAGYAETKDINVNLNQVETSEQMERYLGYATLILTNYLEFRFYKNGEPLGEPISIGSYNGKEILLDESQFSRLEGALTSFFSTGAEPIRSTARLAKIMGAMARRLRDDVGQFIWDEGREGEDLRKIFDAMKHLLVQDLTFETFADLYAQTLVYGLFAARYEDKTPETFTRQEAQELIPRTNPFLREFFAHIAGTSFDQRLAYIVNELCEVFENANVRDLMHKYYQQRTAGDDLDHPDPVIHFYEDFLKEYDPEARKKFGVFYTPVPVVKFIVRSIDDVLKNEFELSKGLADTKKTEITRTVQGKTKKVSVHKVQILDPATGTGTFLNETIRLIHSAYKGQEGAWPSYVREDLLPRLHGFELLMASYTIAHIKIGMELRESRAGELKERLGVYLTNSLEDGRRGTDSLLALGLGEQIVAESTQAAVVKKELPVMVIMGNPPYSASSSNKSDWIQSLVEVYKKDLDEQNQNSLSDDYVKFIRLAEHYVEENKSGIVGMITNNSYIDGKTHRVMRKHLLSTFDKIYILNLHGSLIKGEKTPDGGKDENVFDIRQGVSICIFVKSSQKKKELGKVYYAELWGKQKEKLAQLSGLSLADIKWTTLETLEPHYFFTPKDFGLQDEYDKGIELPKLFKEYGSGIKFRKDNLLVKNFFSRFQAEQMLSDMMTLSNGELQKKYNFKETKDWSLDEKKPLFRGGKEEDIIPIHYRVFDTRYAFYPADKVSQIIVRGDSRIGLMSHMLKENLGLISCRTIAPNQAWDRVLATKNPIEMQVANSGVGQNYLFPLYVYSEDGSRVSNLNQEIVSQIEKVAGPVTPEDVFDYLYAILHSSAYRHAFGEFLKIEFPRIPYPKNKKMFSELVTLGRTLRKSHTFDLSTELLTTYSQQGNNVVSFVDRRGEDVYINDTQYFGNVPEAAWNLTIGGAAPAQKWLKDRKGKTLTREEIDHYQSIVSTLIETVETIKEIDKINIL